jgi:hypothetical protein
MAGLIWAGIGKGIADAGATAANIGVRDYEMREASRLRRDEKEEDRTWREEQKDIDRDRQDERDRMYRKTVEQQTAGNKGTSGMKGVDPADIAPGGKLATAFAAELGMTAPEYERQYNAMKTGDLSAFKTETKDIGKVLDNEYGEQTLTERVVPEGFQKEFQAKSKAIGALSMIYATASEAKNIAEARQTGLVTGAMEGAQAGGDVTKAAQLAAISKGHVPYAGDSNVTRNVFTGDTKETTVGTATIGEKGALAAQATAGAAENTAQAATQTKLGAKYDKDIEKMAEEIKEIKEKTAEAAARTGKIKAETGQVGKEGGKDHEKRQERLSTVINSANATITSLQNSSKGNTAESKATWERQMADAVAMRDQAIALQKEALSGRAESPPPPAAAATTAKGGAPKKVSKAEYDALPSGAQYIDPTGQLRTKK